ncbi:hypothetical protein ACJX0J_007708, partial [Zea mays]
KKTIQVHESWLKKTIQVHESETRLASLSEKQMRSKLDESGTLSVEIFSHTALEEARKAEKATERERLIDIFNFLYDVFLCKKQLKIHFSAEVVVPSQIVLCVRNFLIESNDPWNPLQEYQLGFVDSDANLYAIDLHFSDDFVHIFIDLIIFLYILATLSIHIVSP